MGEFVAPLWMQVLAWAVAVIIAALNVWLLYQTIVRMTAMYRRILVAIENSPADQTILTPRHGSWRR